MIRLSKEMGGGREYMNIVKRTSEKKSDRSISKYNIYK